MANLYVCELTKDQDVMKGLHEYMMDKTWKRATIVCAVGSIYDVTCGNPGSYDMPPKMLQTHVDAPCEIVSFMGEITRKADAPAGLPEEVLKGAISDYLIHVHFTFSHGEDAVVNGGGFRKATVLRAVNVYILAEEE